MPRQAAAKTPTKKAPAKKAAPRRSTALVKTSAAIQAALALEARAIRAKKIYLMRRKGMDWFDIAEELQATEVDCKGLLEEALVSAADAYSDHMKSNLLTLEIDRLNALMASWWDAATEWREIHHFNVDGSVQVDSDGDPIVTRVPPSKDAAAIVRGTIMDRAKLQGLDTVDTTNVTYNTVIVTGNQDDYIKSLQQISEGVHAERTD